MGNPTIVELPTEKDLTQSILEIAKAVIGVTDDSIRQQVQIRTLPGWMGDTLHEP